MACRSFLMSIALITILSCTPSSQEPKIPVACTLIGCSSGVVVHLATPPTTTFRVQLTPRGGTYGTTYAFDCPRAGECPQDIMFPDIITESARVTVTTPREAVARRKYNTLCTPALIRTGLAADLSAGKR